MKTITTNPPRRSVALFLRFMQLSVLSVAIALVTGCETSSRSLFAGSSATPPPSDQEMSAQMAKTKDGAAQVDLEALAGGRSLFSPIPEPALPDASCGMILWTLDDQSPTPILRYVVGKQAEVALGGVLAPFEIVEIAGASRYGVAEEQAFEGAGGLSLNVRVSFGLAFDRGQYLERGIIVIEDAAGWRNVTPVAGLAGCRRQ